MPKSTVFKAIAIVAAIAAAATFSTSIASAAPKAPNKSDARASAATPTAPAKTNANASAGLDHAAFWTSDKINNAIAFDMVFDAGSTVGRRVPAARTVGGTTTSGTLGTRWTSGGLAAAATGKVFFAIGTSYYQCSGSLIKDGKADRAIVLTAGHCVFDNASRAYVTNFIFIPNYDLAAVAIGGCTTSTNCWAAARLSANDGFTSQTSFTSQATWFDWGFATIFDLKNGLLPDGGNGVSADGTNSFAIAFSAMSKGTSVYAFGYPAATPYNGQYLIYSNGSLFLDSNNANKTYGLASDMTGGASGGPWFSNFTATSGGAGAIAQSLNSYKYGTKKYMYGPIFNSATAATYNAAVN